jgi:hypothetical protein
LPFFQKSLIFRCSPELLSGNSENDFAAAQRLVTAMVAQGQKHESNQWQSTVWITACVASPSHFPSPRPSTHCDYPLVRIRKFAAKTSARSAGGDGGRKLLEGLRSSLARLEDMRAALATAERNAETWRTAFEREQAQRALPTPSTNAQQGVQQFAEGAEQPSRLRRAWRWMRATG